MSQALAPFDSIFHSVLGMCTPAELKPPWDFLPKPKDYWTPPADSAALLQDLCARFEPALLIDAGVVERSADGILALHPALTGRHEALQAVRNRDGALTQLLSGLGSLPPQIPPVFAALADPQNAEALKKHRRLWATFSTADRAILDALGQPATLASGLDRLDRSQLQRLYPRSPQYAELSAFDAEQAQRAMPARWPHEEPPGWGEGAEQASADAPIKLGLLGFSLAKPSLDFPELLPAIATAARKAGDHLGLDTDSVSVLRPQAREFEGLTYLLTLRDPVPIAEWLQELWDGSTWTGLTAFVDVEECGRLRTRDASPNLLEARQRLLDNLVANAGSWNPAARQQLLVYKRMAARDVITPLRSQALQTEDVAERCLGLELASVMEMLLGLEPLVHVALDRAAEAYLASGDSTPTLLDPYSKLQDRVLKLCAALRASPRSAGGCSKRRSGPGRLLEGSTLTQLLQATGLGLPLAAALALMFPAGCGASGQELTAASTGAGTADSVLPAP